MRYVPIKTSRCLAAASLLIVFAIDMVTPPTFVADILYLCCMLLVFNDSSRVIRLFTVMACSLIIIDVLLFDLKLNEGPTFWANRGMSVAAIIITSDLAIRFRRLNQASSLKEQQHLEDVQEILYITSHRIRKQVANIMGLTDLVNTYNIILTKDDLKKHCRYLSLSANELDTIIKELNNFIEQSEQEKLQNDLLNPRIHVTPVVQHSASKKREVA